MVHRRLELGRLLHRISKCLGCGRRFRGDHNGHLGRGRRLNSLGSHRPAKIRAWIRAQTRSYAPWCENPLSHSEPDDVAPTGGFAGCVEAEAPAVLAEECEVRTAVVVNDENTLTIVAALNNVVRLPRNDDSGHARHADNPPFAGRKVIK